MLVVTGNPGVGKTYMCAAVINKWGDRKSLLARGIKTVRYWTEYDLLQRMRDHISGGHGGDYVKVLQYITDDELIILDDLGATGRNDWREEILYTFLNQQWSDNRATMITSNYNRREIQQMYHPRIASRLFDKYNVIINMDGNDRRLND